MGARLAFDRLVHSDWSLHPNKRWSAVAIRDSSEWSVESLGQTPAPDTFLSYLLDDDFKTLAGFDFAIGLPKVYLDKIEPDFLSLLSMLGHEPWHELALVAKFPSEVSIPRPFYPHCARRGVKRLELLNALQLDPNEDMLRECEKVTIHRGAASPLFWTLGAKQVGKAALSGWKDILVPARKSGACIWPYDGALSSLTTNTLTIAETYPAEAYGHVEIDLRQSMSKKRQTDRRAAMSALRKRCNDYKIELCENVRFNIDDGFGPDSSGEDPFDALAGLISMIEVSDGRRAEAPNSIIFSKRSEGWILGQIDLACA